MKKWALILILLVSPVCLFSQPTAPGLEDLIHKISQAWESPVDESLAIWKSLLSENAFVMLVNDPTDNAKAHALNRDGFLRLVEMSQRSNPSIKHLHTTQRLTLLGDIAYETALLENHRKNGDVTKSETFNIYRKEGAGWKVIFAAPADQVRKALE